MSLLLSQQYQGVQLYASGSSQITFATVATATSGTFGQVFNASASGAVNFATTAFAKILKNRSAAANIQFASAASANAVRRSSSLASVTFSTFASANQKFARSAFANIQFASSATLVAIRRSAAFSLISFSANASVSLIKRASTSASISVSTVASALTSKTASASANIKILVAQAKNTSASATINFSTTSSAISGQISPNVSNISDVRPRQLKSRGSSSSASSIIVSTQLIEVNNADVSKNKIRGTVELPDSNDNVIAVAKFLAAETIKEKEQSVIIESLEIYSSQVSDPLIETNFENLKHKKENKKVIIEFKNNAIDDNVKISQFTLSKKSEKDTKVSVTFGFQSNSISKR